MSENSYDNGSVTGHGPVKVGYLVTGLVFVGLAGSWALDASGAIDGVTIAWLLPGILVGAGVIGLVAMVASGLRRGGPGAATPGSDSYRSTTHEADTIAGSDTHDLDVEATPEEDHR